MEKLIVEKYQSGLTLIQTGKEFSISADTVRRHLKKTNTPIRDLSESHKDKYMGENSPTWKGGKPHCKICGKILINRKANYCRKHFHTENWRALQSKCGKERVPPKSIFKRGHIPVNKGLIGKDSPLWKGGIRLTRTKNKAKRKRLLGFIPLNECKKDCWVGHHIDYNYVIYIPKEIHKSVWHSVTKDKNMNKINDKVYEWFIKYYLKR